MTDQNSISAEAEASINLAARLISPEGKVRRSWNIGGGISAATTGFELESSNGTILCVLRKIGPRVFRLNPKAAAHEFRRLEVLFHSGFAVPKPLCLDPDCQWYVVQLVDGKPDLNPADMFDHVDQMAHTLAKIHSMPVTDELRENLNGFESTMPSSAPNSEFGELILNQMAKCQIQQSKPVFSHGDFWPGNLLWKDGQLIAVIDWEEACVAPAGFDLGISRLDVLWAFGKDALDRFTQTYQDASGADLTDLSFWDLRAAYRCEGLFEKFAPAYPILHRSDITAEHLQTQQRWFVENALSK